MVEEERGDTCLRLSVDDGPVDGCCPTVLWQQGGMDIEGAETGHSPHYFGQHAEGYNHLQISLIATQFLNKIRVFHLHWLEHGDVVCQGVFLHLRGLEGVLMTTYGFVGLGDHSNDLIVVFHQCFQGANRELGGAHEYDSKIFFLHLCAKVIFILDYLTQKSQKFSYSQLLYTF